MRRTMLFVLLMLTAGAPAAGTPPASTHGADRAAPWYRGIVPGQSRREDVLKALGAPDGTTTTTSDDGGSWFDDLVFKGDPVFETVQVEIEPDSQLVHSLLLEPGVHSYPVRKLFKNYGRRYVVRDPDKGGCSSRKYTPAQGYDPGLDEPQDSDALYVYSGGRMEVYVDGGGQVESIKFLRSCPVRILSYRGIVPGQSRKEDVLKTFGTPLHQGPGQLDQLPGRQFDELGFRVGDAVYDSPRVLFEPGSDVVFAVRLTALFAYDEQQLFEAYGDHYVVRDPYKDRCSNEAYTPGKDYNEGLDQRQDSDTSYVYGDGQLVAYVDGGGHVKEVLFQQRCSDRGGKP